MSYAAYLSDLMVKLAQATGGDGGAGHVHVQRELPILRAVDPVTILTQFAPGVVHAVAAQNFAGVRRVEQMAPPDPTRIPNSTFVDTNGSFNGDASDIRDINAGSGSSSCTAAQYVAAYGEDASPWKRRLGTASFLGFQEGTYEPCSDLTSDTSGGAGSIAFVRQTMIDWQACVNFAAQVVANNSADTSAKLDGGTVEAFYQLLGKLADDLDVLEENPPATPDIGDALRYAKGKTEGAVRDIAKKGGEAAAELGNLAGQVAGSFGSGFFSQATFLTLAVAGVAVFVLLK